MEDQIKEQGGDQPQGRGIFDWVSDAVDAVAGGFSTAAGGVVTIGNTIGNGIVGTANTVADTAITTWKATSDTARTIGAAFEATGLSIGQETMEGANVAAELGKTGTTYAFEGLVALKEYVSQFACNIAVGSFLSAAFVTLAADGKAEGAFTALNVAILTGNKVAIQAASKAIAFIIVEPIYIIPGVARAIGHKSELEALLAAVINKAASNNPKLAVGTAGAFVAALVIGVMTTLVCEGKVPGGPQLWSGVQSHITGGNSAEIVPAPQPRTYLRTGDFLKTGEYLTTANGKYYMLMQKDGNLVIYPGSGPGAVKGPALWSSGVLNGGGQFFVIMQNDGNLVVYKGTGPGDNRGAIWSAQKQDGGKLFYALLDDDGVLSVNRGLSPTLHGGVVWATRDKRSFTVFEKPTYPKTIALRASTGENVTAQFGGGGALSANSGNLSAWEVFTLIDRGNGRVALQTFRGHYLMAQGGGGDVVVANSPNLSTWETFTLYNLGKGQVAFQAQNGQYVCAEGGGGGSLFANRNAIGPWETFSLIDLSASVIICQGRDYGIPTQVLSVGNYDADTLSIGNDQVSSIIVPPGLTVTLFEHAGFKGKTKTFTRPTAYVGDDFNDITSSVKVEKQQVVPNLIATFGGVGGSRFDSAPVSKIGFRCGEVIDAIFINDIKRGGDGGFIIDPIKLAQDEYFNSIVVNWGAVINYIKLTTNKGRIIEGGVNGGAPAKALQNIRILEIGGRSGQLLDSLEITYIDKYTPSQAIG